MTDTPPRRLILHVGQTKAGSTAIQNYLDSQRAALRAAAVLFPQTFFLRRNPVEEDRTPGHLGLVKALEAGEGLDGFHEECAQSGCSTLILSIENLFHDQPDKMLSSIGNALSDWRVELVAVLRAFPDWLASRYIEEVVTGYRRGDMVLAEFAEAMIEQGAHDYAARLNHLSGLLNARRTLAINYDAATACDGLVPTFLAVTGLPPTDPALARSIQANVRQKSWFLVESVRRQNHVLRSAKRCMQTATRRQFEAMVRRQAQVIAQDKLPQQPVLAEPEVPLDPETCRQISASNRLLQSMYGLASPLRDPSPTLGLAGPLQRRQAWPGTDALTLFGLQTAAALCQKNAAAAKSRAGKGGVSWAGADTPDTQLAETGIGAAIDVLAGVAVSLHLDSPETALWAACMTNRLPILLATSATSLPDSDRLGALRLPSDVVCLNTPLEAALGCAPVLPQVLAYLLNTRPCQVVVAPASTPLDTLALLEPLIGPDTVLILITGIAAQAQAVADMLDLVVRAAEGKIFLLTRVSVGAPDHANVQAPVPTPVPEADSLHVSWSPAL